MTNNRKTKSKILNFRYGIIYLLSIILIFTSVSCSQQEEIFTPGPSATETVQPTPAATLPLAFTPQLIPPPYFAWIDPALPDAVQMLISQQTEINITPSKDLAIMIFSSARSQEVGSWTYLLVAPFYSSLENVSFADISAIWETGIIDIPGYDRLHISEESAIHLSQFWGVPAPGGLTITEDDQILEDIWNDSTALAIIPFEQLEPSYKVISIDHQNPLLPSDGKDIYSLSFPIYLSITDSLLYQPFETNYLTNFDRSKLTSVVLTGVTALVRSTASIIEKRGILYPAEDIRDLLRSADITHISNEVPFAVDCPPPDSDQDNLLFCSNDSYIELLESIGTDIVELSGDHFADFGPEAMLHSLDIYSTHNLITYGGGRNLQEGLEPVTIIHNGNKIAFIGCNAKIHEGYATASQTNPGASRCDFEFMQQKIAQLSSDGYIVIATMQHEEVDDFYPIALQKHDFQLLSEAGASIVSGSQAHHPQGVEISGSKFIHYGLGNLFFDQWNLAINDPDIHANKDKAFIDFHYFYNGKYINTRLIPLQFVDNAKPRLMTQEEETPFLFEFYKASKWNNLWIYLFPTEYYNFLKSQ
jgi:poly-gamma-glutamate synthesis protein (capsule biosynthesis protein)